MRYYKVTVTPQSADGTPSAKVLTFTNQVNGKADLGAPQVEFDIPLATFDQPAGAGRVTLWGPSLAQIAEASDYNGANIKVEGGMQTGLPLATAQAKFAGTLVQGRVNAAYGNWLGINQTLDFVVTANGGATQSDPVNLVVDWKKGDNLAAALQKTLSTAYPDATLDIRISDGLVLPADEPSYHYTIEQLSQYVNAVSERILNPDGSGTYAGVSIFRDQDTIHVYDFTQPADPIQLEAADFIGQITWIGAFQLQWSMAMRADIHVGSTVKFPQVLALQTQTTPQSQSQARGKTTFQGTFYVSNVRHVGNSRAPDAQGWVTTYVGNFTQDVGSDVAPDSTSL